MPEINAMELMTAFVKIRNAAERVSVSGYENRELVNYIFSTCNELIKKLDVLMSNQHEQKEMTIDGSNKNFS